MDRLRRCCGFTQRSPFKEAFAEMLATMVLTLCGEGVTACVVLGRMQESSLVLCAIGWGLGLMIAVAIAGKVSGGHANPAVTLALATAKKCSWRNVIPYMVAQYIGSFLAALHIFFIYSEAIAAFDGGVRSLPPAENATAQIFATYPQEYASVGTCIVDQLVGTSLLVIIICAATDKFMNVPTYVQPFIIGLGLTTVTLTVGYNCGAAVNPARDFAPRILTAMLGWGSAVFSYNDYKWFWIPILIPHVGGILGAWTYLSMIEHLRGARVRLPSDHSRNFETGSISHAHQNGDSDQTSPLRAAAALSITTPSS